MTNALHADSNRVTREYESGLHAFLDLAGLGPARAAIQIEVGLGGHAASYESDTAPWRIVFAAAERAAVPDLFRVETGSYPTIAPRRTETSWHHATEAFAPLTDLRCDGTPAFRLSADGNTIYCAADVPFLAHWLISRQEEAAGSDSDQFDSHERFDYEASHLTKLGVLEIPVLDVWANALRAAVSAAGWPIPLVDLVDGDAAERGWACVMSHDVDHIDLVGRQPASCLRSTWRTRIADRLGRGLVAGQRALRAWSDFEESHGWRSTWYFLGQPSGTVNRGYEVDEPTLQHEIRRLRDNGHEVGLHGSYDAMCDGDALRTERDRIARLAGAELLGIRMHYLRARHPETPEIQHQSGFLYDATPGYTPRLGFRAGTSQPFPGLRADGSEIGLSLVPFSMMDCTFFTMLQLSVDDAKAAMRDQMRMLKELGGVGVLLFHPCRLTTDGDHYDELYRYGIEEASRLGATPQTAIEIATRARDRHAATLTLQSRDDERAVWTWGGCARCEQARNERDGRLGNTRFGRGSQRSHAHPIRPDDAGNSLMCGFAGVIGERRGDPSVIQSMTDVLAHRGPDGEGFFRAEPDEMSCGVSFGHRRLAIVDLSAGHQPLVSPNKRFALVFNGEIYNHRELRSELEDAGHTFTTECDTEVILHGFAAWGAEVTTRLRGMYAFAIWDSVERVCFVARDQMGIKPLYWTLVDGRVSFASEIKGLLADRRVERRPSYDGIDAYLGGMMFPGTMTAFAGVHQLEPGHRMWIRPPRGPGWDDRRQSTDVEIEHYFQIPFPASASLSDWDEQSSIERVLDGGRETVNLRLMADVPIGIFLSGGVDSSFVCALACQMASDPIRSYSMTQRGENEHLSEAQYIDAVVAALDLPHTDVTGDVAWVDDAPQIIRAFDQPCTTAMNSYRLAERASRDVKVVLTGTGGDEGFAGYGRYLLADPEYRTSKGISDLRAAFTQRVTSFLPADRSSLYSRRARGRTSINAWESEVHRHFDRDDLPDDLARCLHVDQRLYLIDNLHNNMDKVAMAHSLEARVPLCDHRFLALANSIPGSRKMQDGELKHVLKAAAATLVPREVIYRKKLGFGVPIQSWFRGRLGARLAPFLERRAVKRRGMFNWREVERLRSLTMSGKADHARRLWMLASIEIWFRMYIDGKFDGVSQTPSLDELAA